MKLSLAENTPAKELNSLVDLFINNDGNLYPKADCLITSFKNSSQLKIMAEYALTPPKYSLMHGSHLGREAKNEILISETYMLNLPIEFLHKIYGKEVRIDGNAFTIIGSYLGRYNYDFAESSVMIPLLTYIELGYPLQYLDIVFQTSLSTDEETFLYQLLSANNCVEQIEMPDKLESKNLENMFSNLGKHILLFCIFLVGLLNLLNFWLKSNWRRFQIYIICGSTNRFVLFIIFVNTLLLSLIGSLTGWLIFIIIQPGLVKYDVVAIYPPIFATAICLVIIGASCLCTLIIGVLFLKKQNLAKLQVSV